MLDVFKRILATALGAMGLGALAAGSAFAQSQTPGLGNIPAPDIFDDQITCSMNVPSAMNTPMPTQIPMSGMTSPLDDIIGMGDRELNTTDLTDATHLQTLMDLGYVIPAMGANCGRGPLDTTDAMTIADTASFLGYDSNGDGDFEDDGDIAPKNSIPADVAKGYSDVLDAFVAAYGDPGVGTDTGTAGALADAQKALTAQIEGGATGSALTPYQNAVTTAQAAHDKAKAAFDAISQGPIYQAGVAEWMAKAAVTKSVSDYNMAVVAANMAKTTLDGLAYAKYVPLGNTELIDAAGTNTAAVVTGLDTDDPMVTLSELIQYTNGNLNDPQVGTQGMAGTGDGTGDDAPMGSVTTASNFDASGNLIVPTEVNTDTTDNLLDIRPTVVADGSANLVSAVRTRAEQYNKAAEAIKKLRDENVNPLVQATYDEAYRRAKAEADYYNAELAEVLADTTDMRTDAQKLSFVDTNGNGVRDTGEVDNTDYEANPITIARRNSEYTAEKNKRFTAEQNLRQAVADREMATANVRMQFTSPHSFYNQLIARREALKAAADKVVADAEAPTKAQTDAASDAAEALTAAQKAQADFAELYADEDDPSVDLINTLLATDGDDGQALVDAISSNYDTANEAKTAADSAVDMVSGLTGDDGQVAQNTSAIEGHETRIAANEGEIWDADGNSRIDANETRSMENRTMIATNTTNIAANADNIMANRTDIDSNTGRITQNESDIMTNAGNIADNRGMIEHNHEDILENRGMIEHNHEDILGNRAVIDSNQMSIMRNTEDIQTLKAGVAASMALAGMPEMGARGVSVGAGSYGGETALAVGVHFSGENARFKIGVTSSGGETGASLGAGWSF